MLITSFIFKIQRTIEAHWTCYRCLRMLRRDDAYQKFCSDIQILNRKDTVEKLLREQCSVSRYGDGEFYVMGGSGNGFQQNNAKLAQKLKEALDNPLPNLLLCIPRSLVAFGEYNLFSKRFIQNFLCREFRRSVSPYVKTDQVYGDALFTRFYMNLKDKSNVGEFVSLLKQLWANRDILIVEGVYSRLGVGNDLFNNAKSIQRILCPSVNAFDSYDEILEEAKTKGEGKLIILAIGMTATVLAYDLAKEGLQALDLGHIDVEYEWFKRKAKTKIPLPYKAVNEAGQNTSIPECNEPAYKSSIIKSIGI